MPLVARNKRMPLQMARHEETMKKKQLYYQKTEQLAHRSFW
jgi:hypothetical protein